MRYLESGVEVGAVDAERDTHQHLLRALSNLAIDLQEIAPLECLKNIINLLISNR